MSIYLDCNATTPLEKEVVDKINHFLVNEYGNEGSIHMNLAPEQNKLRKQHAMK